MAMDLVRILGGAGVALFMVLAPQLGLPYMDAIPLVGPGAGDGDAAHRETLARIDVEVGPRVALATMDAEGRRTALRVLWAEVDGAKLDQGGKGQGKVDRLLFVVAAPGALSLGGEPLTLRPGDRVTVDGLDGKWAYAPDGMVGVLRVEGTALSARVGEEGLRPVGTDEHRVAPDWALRGDAGDGEDASGGAAGGPPAPWTPGAAQGEAEVASGRTTFVRLVTRGAGEAGAGAGPAEAELRQTRARDVEVNGEPLEGARWGEGALAMLRFTIHGEGAALRGEAGEEVPVGDGQRVTILDFIGAYVIFHTSKGDARVALEGWAREVEVGEADDATGPAGPASGAAAIADGPVASMDWQPAQPTTAQAVRFVDRSLAPEGRIVARAWRFGDGATSSERDPVHRYADDGVYTVTLLVTDHRRVTTSVTREIRVLNLAPDAGFESTPEAPNTADAVQFVDQSQDRDGRISAWRWDFGDGSTPSTEQHPRHVFPDNGRYDVALTVWDDDGEPATLRRVVEVRNLVPQARFAWEPRQPLSGEEVRFRDASLDPDGKVVAWRWDFGDGTASTAQHPNHAYRTKGAHKVTLTAVDDDGGEHRWTGLVDVRNAPPVAGFAFDPPVPTEGQPVRFTDASTDPDGRIVERVWNFGDGAVSGLAAPQHAYGSGGTKVVTLTVKDDDGARTTAMQTLRVNRKPLASFSLLPEVPSMGDLVRLTDASTDPDGHIVAWRWSFGDGNTSHLRDPEHRWDRPGLYDVLLVVTDEHGGEGRQRRMVNVTNVAPRADFSWLPRLPTQGDLVNFTALAQDHDGGIASWRWDFGDGSGASGPEVRHRFARAGTHEVRLTVTDADGSQANTTRLVAVNARPLAGFTTAPSAPSVGSEIRFTDTTTDPDGTLVAWRWSFGDGATSQDRHPRHTFGKAGVYPVRLVVTDDDGGTAEALRSLVVGSLAPKASFTVAPEQPRAGQEVQFTDTSTDPDGAVTRWAWDFGDGTTSTEASPRHRYAQSGTYAVTLAATDDSGKRDTARRLVQVFSSEALEVVVRFAYPDGQPLDVAREGVHVEVRESASGARLAKGPGGGLVVGSDGSARGTFAPGQWSAGDLVAVVLRVPGAIAEQAEVMPLPGHGNLGTVYARMPMTGRLQLAPDTDPAVPSGTYTDPTQQVRGWLRVTWRDGTPVRDATVRLGYEWLQLGTYGHPVPHPVGHTILTDAEGLVPVAVPFTVGGPDGPGTYLPGAYRIQARAEKQVADGMAMWQAPHAFQMDPLGLRASLRGN